MQIWVDADACPAVIKEILFRAAQRLRLPTTLVANKPLRTPSSHYLRTIQVARGVDVADSEIARRVEPGDLVITADIPLAADIIGRGAHALNPRGDFYTPDNVREHLSMRDFMEELRGSGVQTGGPKPLDQTDRKRFADQLDRFTSRWARINPCSGQGAEAGPAEIAGRKELVPPAGDVPLTPPPRTGPAAAEAT